MSYRRYKKFEEVRNGVHTGNYITKPGEYYDNKIYEDGECKNIYVPGGGGDYTDDSEKLTKDILQYLDDIGVKYEILSERCSGQICTGNKSGVIVPSGIAYYTSPRYDIMTTEEDDVYEYSEFWGNFYPKLIDCNDENHATHCQYTLTYIRILTPGWSTKGLYYDKGMSYEFTVKKHYHILKKVKESWTYNNIMNGLAYFGRDVNSDTDWCEGSQNDTSIYPYPVYELNWQQVRELAGISASNSLTCSGSIDENGIVPYLFYRKPSNTYYWCLVGYKPATKTIAFVNNATLYNNQQPYYCANSCIYNGTGYTFEVHFNTTSFNDYSYSNLKLGVLKFSSTGYTYDGSITGYGPVTYTVEKIENNRVLITVGGVTKITYSLEEEKVVNVEE